ncbi:site-specific recombinase XerD [Actinomadura verrucosospora]|uniref:Site-specific recombinase XerD n=1 Tax=Actinomadura verrucosospora TaxID=46165 RepID=A0A7D3ZCM2_ACTVE|nr:site-specific recombinase XerD [Actinomadura verrucosospora]
MVPPSPGGPGADVAAGGAPPPAVLMLSVGDIPGLAPRRRPRQGQVPAADVDLVDRLPRPQVWPTVAAWLQSHGTARTRQAYLKCLAAFLRWLEAAAPGCGLWEVTEDVLVSYKDQILTATGAAAPLLRGGRPLGAAAAAQRISALRSLYAYAHRRRVIGHSPAAFVDPPAVPKEGQTPALSKQDAAALARGLGTLAQSHPQDAAAVALLLYTGMRSGEAQQITVGAFAVDGGHRVARYRIKGGTTHTALLPDQAWALLEPLTRGRPRREPLLQRPLGDEPGDERMVPWDEDRVLTAVRRAARAAGLTGRVVPHMLRATVITLLHADGVSRDDVQAMVAHANGQTTQRYERTGVRLDDHPGHRLSALLTGRDGPGTS